MAKNRELQMVVPAPAAQPRQETPPRDEAKKYLEEAGWTMSGENERGETFWMDPAASGKPAGVSTKAVSLPGRDGSDPIVVTQVRVPPAAWNHPMVDAVNIQRMRDARTNRG